MAANSLPPQSLALGKSHGRLAHDLALVNRQPSDHHARKLALAAAGVFGPGAAATALFALGLPLGIGAPLVAAAALGVAGFVLPDILLRANAARLRNEFRQTLAAYLDLVWIAVAGGAGIDSALTGAATNGHGWAAEQIRRALDTARLTRASPWSALRDLGDRLDIGDLAELAASVSLAGCEGARIRASLAARTRAMRTRQTTEAEQRAQAATERMSLPVAILFLGFLALIGYPAINQVLTGL
ncbi:type II secretion system F family protein [Actinokineospora pegani]|uniref:type II secretion system F family protein n=1 Tax=Actinokineospora pegani TaxID=2654637 RepID=UPI001F25D408|nr:type II secretion system F family protein [Actinokineospora pegani]